jgi:tetratricopeptide (TPR) repeat protein
MFFRFYFKYPIFLILLLLTYSSYCQKINNDFYTDFEQIKKIYYSGKYDIALEKLENICIIPDGNEMGQYIAVENMKGLINVQLCNYDKAVKNYLNALANTEDLIKKAKILNNVGIVYKHKLNYSKSLTYYSYALNIVNESKLKENKKFALTEYIYYSMAIIYSNQDKFKEAIVFF